MGSLVAAGLLATELDTSLQHSAEVAEEPVNYFSLGFRCPDILRCQQTLGPEHVLGTTVIKGALNPMKRYT